jgi:hypothetical protein
MALVATAEAPPLLEALSRISPPKSAVLLIGPEGGAWQKLIKLHSYYSWFFMNWERFFTALLL